MFVLAIKYFFFLSFLFLLSCSPANVQIEKFSLCQQLSHDHCIPPLIAKQTVYYLNNPHVSSNMQQYIDSVERAEKTLSFAFSFNRKLNPKEQQLWQKNLKARYYFPTKEKNKEKFYLFESLTFYNKNVNASVSLASMLEKKFPNAIIQDYQTPDSFSIVIELYQKPNNILVKRTITIEIVHERK